MHRILDVRGLADLDDGRISLPEGKMVQDSQIQQITDDPLLGYSDEQLLRLLEQFSHTESVKRELHRRYCNDILSTITLPASLLEEWKRNKML